MCFLPVNFMMLKMFWWNFQFRHLIRLVWPSNLTEFWPLQNDVILPFWGHSIGSRHMFFKNKKLWNLIKINKTKIFVFFFLKKRVKKGKKIPFFFQKKKQIFLKFVIYLTKFLKFSIHPLKGKTTSFWSEGKIYKFT
jgi:hypothetical protein